MTGKLAGKTAIVTGASAGIGEATVRALAAEGANTVLAARREEKLESLKTDIEEAYGTPCLVAPGVSRAEQHEPGEVLAPEAIADAILFAATQEEPTTAAQIDMYRRDMFNFL